MTSNPFKPIPRPTALRACLLVGLLAASTLAGCLYFDESGRDLEQGDLAAALQVDRTERWTGEAFTFDGRSSTGSITHWVLDLGDGTREKGDNISGAHVQHDYEQGGVYEVRFTVYSEHPGESNTTDDRTRNRTGAHAAQTTEILVVNERQQIEETVITTSALNGSLPLPNETALDRHEHAFEVSENATSVETDVHLENLDKLQEAHVTIRILDETNASIAEQNSTLDPEQEWTLRLEGNVDTPGDYTVEITADSGTVRADGSLRIYYTASGSDVHS